MTGTGFIDQTSDDHVFLIVIQPPPTEQILIIFYVYLNAFKLNVYVIILQLEFVHRKHFDHRKNNG